MPYNEPVRLLSVATPFTVNELVILTLPVNWCVSVNKLPNLVDPVTNSVEAVINWTCSVCAVMSPYDKILEAVKLLLTKKLSADDAVVAETAIDAVKAYEAEFAFNA